MGPTTCSATRLRSPFIRKILSGKDFNPVPDPDFQTVEFKGLVEVDYGGSEGALVHDGTIGSPWTYTQKELDEHFKPVPDDLTIRRRIPHTYNDWTAMTWGELRTMPGVKLSLAWTPDDLQRAKEDSSLMYVVTDARAYLPDEEGASLASLRPLESKYSTQEDLLFPAPVLLVFKRVSRPLNRG